MSGKPKGCRNTTTILFDELLKANAKELIEKAIEMAKDGDGPALRLCIERLAPARKDRPVWFDLPEMNEARDGVNASAAIVEAVATGELTQPPSCSRKMRRAGLRPVRGGICLSIAVFI